MKSCGKQSAPVLHFSMLVIQGRFLETVHTDAHLWRKNKLSFVGEIRESVTQLFFWGRGEGGGLRRLWSVRHGCVSTSLAPAVPLQYSERHNNIMNQLFWGGGANSLPLQTSFISYLLQ